MSMSPEAARLFHDAAENTRALAKHYRDPVEAAVAPDEQADRDRAKRRGQRIADLADWLAAEAFMLRHPPTQADVYNAALKILADALYGNQAIDMPGKR